MGQAVLSQSLPVCPVCLADSLPRLCESDVVPVVLAAFLQHVSGPRQPLEDAGSLPHRHLLYPLMQHHKHVTFWYGRRKRLDPVSAGCRSFSRQFKVFLLTRLVSQPWISPTSGTTPCWSCRWAGPSPGGWWTSPTRSTSSSRWSRRSSRDSGGGGASRWVCVRVRLGKRGRDGGADSVVVVVVRWSTTGPSPCTVRGATRCWWPKPSRWSAGTCTFFYLLLFDSQSQRVYV